MCEREGCWHQRVMHPAAGPCRMTGCSCEAFVAPPATAKDPFHEHRWQPAGLLERVNGRHATLAALCQCGAVIRLRVPDEPLNA